MFDFNDDDVPALIEWFKQHRSELNSKESLPPLLKEGIEKRAYKCIAAILASNRKLLNPDDLDQLLRIAAEQWDGLMVLQLANNDHAVAARYLFSNKNLKNEDTLKSFFQTLLRFMPFDSVDKILQYYLEENNADKELFSRVFQKTRHEFLAVAPYFSRYVKIKVVSKAYGHYGRDSKDFNLSETQLSTKMDMQYGQKRATLAENISVALAESKPMLPTREDLLSLPPSSSPQKTRRAAAILEMVADLLYQDQKKKDFNTLRNSNYLGMFTYIAGQYSSAIPLVKAVSTFSTSEDIVKNDKDQYSLRYKVDNNWFVVNRIVYDNVAVDNNGVPVKMWLHGSSPVDKTWGKIEDVFEKILAMDLKNPTQEKFTEFYQHAAELVWLIGNTQPLNRGSGSFAEIMLAIIHRYHKIQPPVLKTAFPQLDVLDITFPLDDYKFLFPYFFEPSTMPDHLRFKDINTSKPIAHQMKELYEKLNHSKEMKKHTVILHKDNKEQKTPTLRATSDFSLYARKSNVVIVHKDPPVNKPAIKKGK